MVPEGNTAAIALRGLNTFSAFSSLVCTFQCISSQHATIYPLHFRFLVFLYIHSQVNIRLLFEDFLKRDGVQHLRKKSFRLCS